MLQSDFAFANDIRAAIELRTPRTARLLLAAMMALLVCFVVWAHFAILDEVKRGDGRVVPSQQIQVVQSLEGGIAGAILVKEGDIVRKGQPLVRLDDTKFASELGEISQRQNAMAARVARLEAEAHGKDIVTFSQELSAAAPAAVNDEKNVFELHARKLADEINVLTQEASKLSDTLTSYQHEVDLTRPLYQQKVVPEIEMIRLARQTSDTQGQLAEVRAKISNVTASFRAQAADDLAKSKDDLAVLDENIKSAQDRVRRAVLQAPVYGIVNKVNITTVGAVLQPGADIMDIVPLDDTLLVEGHIRPQDIAFIRPGQDAVVKVTAYDSSIYGSLKGKVERISADTIEEKTDNGQRSENFYRVMIRTDKNHLGTPDHPLPIIPGMVTTVDILTGRKSVLDYLIKPARLLRDEALREH